MGTPQFDCNGAVLLWYVGVIQKAVAAAAAAVAVSAVPAVAVALAPALAADAAVVVAAATAKATSAQHSLAQSSQLRILGLTIPHYSQASPSQARLLWVF